MLGYELEQTLSESPRQGVMIGAELSSCLLLLIVLDLVGDLLAGSRAVMFLRLR